MSAPALEIYNSPNVLAAIQTLLLREIPRFSPYAARLFFTWLTLQAALYAFLPAQIGYGQRTPAGHILPYKVLSSSREPIENTDGEQWVHKY